MIKDTFNAEPELVQVNSGEWLATTSANSPLRIGVMGITENDARTLFHASLTRWREINEAEAKEVTKAS